MAKAKGQLAIAATVSCVTVLPMPTPMTTNTTFRKPACTSRFNPDRPPIVTAIAGPVIR